MTVDQNTGSVPKRSKLVRTLLEWVEELVIAVVLIAVVLRLQELLWCPTFTAVTVYW